MAIQALIFYTSHENFPFKNLNSYHHCQDLKVLFYMEILDLSLR